MLEKFGFEKIGNCLRFECGNDETFEVEETKNNTYVVRIQIECRGEFEVVYKNFNSSKEVEDFFESIFK